MKTGIYHCKSFSVPTRFYKQWADWFLRLQQEVGDCRLHVVYKICHLRNLVVLPHRTEEESLNDDYDDLNHSFDHGWEIIVTKRQQKKILRKYFFDVQKRKCASLTSLTNVMFSPILVLLWSSEKKNQLCKIFIIVIIRIFLWCSENETNFANQQNLYRYLHFYTIILFH